MKKQQLSDIKECVKKLDDEPEEGKSQRSFISSKIKRLNFDPVSYLVLLATTAKSEFVQLQATCKLLDAAFDLKSSDVVANSYTLNVLYKDKKELDKNSDDLNKLSLLSQFDVKNTTN